MEVTVDGKNVHCYVSEAKKILCIEAATPAIQVTDLPEEDPPLLTPELCRRTLVKSSDPDEFYLVQVRLHISLARLFPYKLFT